MPFRCLSDFLEELDRPGNWSGWRPRSIRGLEIAEITARVCRAEGPALLLPAVRGHEIPVLTNVLGTEARIVPGLGRGRSGPKSAGDRPSWSSRPGPRAGSIACGRRRREWPLGKHAAAAGESGGLPADRPPGQRRGPGRLAAAASRPAGRRPRDCRGRGLYGRARFAPAGVWSLRPGAAGARSPGRRLGRP